MFKQFEIESLLNEFNSNISSETSQHRYASFDFCYSYFNSFGDKKEIASDKNIEQSCLHLGFYLASWGMLRGSSFLLQNNLRFYKPLIKVISLTPNNIWAIDIDNYNSSNIKDLINIYKELSSHYNNNRALTLTTKIMLGVFGNVPAFDDFFCYAFRKKYPDYGFRAFNEKSLSRIADFYNDFSDVIKYYQERLACKNFSEFRPTDLKYTKAKIVDMIGFQYGKNNYDRK